MTMRRNDWIRLGIIAASIGADFALGRSGMVFCAALIACVMWGRADGEKP